MNGAEFCKTLWSQLVGFNATDSFPKDIKGRDRGYVYQIKKSSATIHLFFPTYEHETAHMVEMNNFSRLLQNDWGMSTISLDKSKQSSYFAALSRETRVRAIQAHLEKMSGKIRTGFENDHWFWAGRKFLPFGRFQSEKHLKDWVQSIFDSTFSRWCTDRIQHEWKRRAEFIRNWQES